VVSIALGGAIAFRSWHTRDDGPVWSTQVDTHAAWCAANPGRSFPVFGAPREMAWHAVVPCSELRAR
jgi:hypothetical protein